MNSQQFFHSLGALFFIGMPVVAFIFIPAGLWLKDRLQQKA